MKVFSTVSQGLTSTLYLANGRHLKLLNTGHHVFHWEVPAWSLSPWSKVRGLEFGKKMTHDSELGFTWKNVSCSMSTNHLNLEERKLGRKWFAFRVSLAGPIL